MTYTAFDGVNVSQQLLETRDFLTFTASPMAGDAARGKGLALFPRKVRGRYAALSRSDRETNAVAFSDDVRCWSTPHLIQSPTRSWEILQLGNCGSPIETRDGWLVITHGVGPMRTYSLGAILLANVAHFIVEGTYERRQMLLAVTLPVTVVTGRPPTSQRHRAQARHAPPPSPRHQF